MLLLDVPYSEKDEAKALGARWDPEIKKWYVSDECDYYKFLKWIYREGNTVACENLYVVEGKKRCFKCGKETKVISFAADNYWLFDDMESLLGERVDLDELSRLDANNVKKNCYFTGDLNLVGMIENIPKPMYTYLRSKYNIKQCFSKTTRTTSMSNCCDNCDVLQGSFFLYEEVDSPFWIQSASDVEKLKFYKFPLKNDLIIDPGPISWSTSDSLMKEYGNFEVINLFD